MKFGISSLGLGIVAAALVGSASAASPETAKPLTIAHAWSIEHETLMREFSVGLGVDVASLEAAPLKVALASDPREEKARKDEQCAPGR